MNFTKTQKIVSGLALIIAGLAGGLFGTTIKQKVLRIVVLIFSGLMIVFGFHVFVSGLDDVAVGVIARDGDDMRVEELVFADRDAFKKSMEGTFATSPDVRRLKFVCDDESNEFTVFNTRIGIFGAPAKSILCADNKFLLRYEKNESQAKQK